MTCMHCRRPITEQDADAVRDHDTQQIKGYLCFDCQKLLMELEAMEPDPHVWSPSKKGGAQ